MTRLVYSLLMKNVLPRTSSFAARERAFVIPFACKDTSVTGKMTRSRKGAIAGRTDVFLLRRSTRRIVSACAHTLDLVAEAVEAPRKFLVVLGITVYHRGGPIVMH